jgi:hypothetical protein
VSENFSGRVKEAKCPACAARLDAATSIDSAAAPGPGDYTVCIYCGSACRYSEWMDLEAMTEGDLLALQNENPESFAVVMLLQTVARQALKARRCRDARNRN